jgi:hypothetical protein
MTEETLSERAAAPSTRERAALLIAVVCTVVVIAALMIPKVHEMYAGLTLPAAR